MGNTCCASKKPKGVVGKRRLSVALQRDRQNLEMKMQLMLREEESDRLFWELLQTTKTQLSQPGFDKVVVGVAAELFTSRTLTAAQKFRALLFLKELMEMRFLGLMRSGTALLPAMEAYVASAPAAEPEKEAALRVLLLECLAHWAEIAGEVEPEYRSVVERLRSKNCMQGIALSSPRFYHLPRQKADVPQLRKQVLNGFLNHPVDRAQIKAVVVEFEQLPSAVREKNPRDKAFFAKIKSFLRQSKLDRVVLLRFLIASFDDEEPVTAVLQPLLADAEREKAAQPHGQGLPFAFSLDESMSPQHPGLKLSERMSFGLSFEPQTPLHEHPTLNSQTVQISAVKRFEDDLDFKVGFSAEASALREAEQLQREIDAKEKAKQFLEAQLRAAPTTQRGGSPPRLPRPRGAMEQILWEKEEAIYSLRSAIDEINQMLAVRRPDPLEGTLSRQLAEVRLGFGSRSSLTKQLGTISAGYAFVDEIYSDIEHSLTTRVRPPIRI